MFILNLPAGIAGRAGIQTSSTPTRPTQDPRAVSDGALGWGQLMTEQPDIQPSVTSGTTQPPPNSIPVPLPPSADPDGSTDTLPPAPETDQQRDPYNIRRDLGASDTGTVPNYQRP